MACREEWFVELIQRTSLRRAEDSQGWTRYGIRVKLVQVLHPTQQIPGSPLQESWA